MRVQYLEVESQSHEVASARAQLTKSPQALGRTENEEEVDSFDDAEEERMRELLERFYLA